MSLPRRALPFLASAALAAPVLLTGLVEGCSSNSAATATGDCNTDPFSCPSGKTCSLQACTCTTPQCTDSNCTPQFDCLPSGNTGLGENCEAQLGSTSCADGLACVVFGGSGLCSSYCDEAHPCGTGYECQTVTFQIAHNPMQPTIRVCEVSGFDGGIFVIDGGQHGNDDSGKSEAGSHDVVIPDGLLSDINRPR